MRVRLATAGDRDLLREGFDRLSDQSRYQRFFTPTPHLSRSTVDSLLDVGADHVVLVAMARTDTDAPGGTGTDSGADNHAGTNTEGDTQRENDNRHGGWAPAGGVRAVWLDDEPGTAEMAITVIDAYQGRGLGTLLTAAVAAVAAERGITTLSAEVLAVNEPMRGVLRSFGAEMQSHPDDATVITARLDTAVASARLPTRERLDLLAAVARAEQDRTSTTEPG